MLELRLVSLFYFLPQGAAVGSGVKARASAGFLQGV